MRAFRSSAGSRSPRQRGVLFHAGKQFHFGERAVAFARMGYAALTEAEIAEAVRQAWNARGARRSAEAQAWRWRVPNAATT